MFIIHEMFFVQALRLSKTSLGETTVGQIMNLLSNDVNRFDVALRFIQFIWIGPLATIVVTYFLWQEIGVSSLVGIFVILAVIPLQGLCKNSLFIALSLVFYINN